MRSIITCLILFCFQSFLLQGKEREDTMQLKKVKSLVIKNQLSVKKNYSSVLQRQFSEILPTIYHELKVHDIKLVGLVHYSQNVLASFINSTNSLKKNESHRYIFIFNFFCPKHAFW